MLGEKERRGKRWQNDSTHGSGLGKQKSLLADGSHQAALSCDEKYKELVGPRGDPDVRQRLHPDRLQMVRDESGQDRENGGVS